MHLFRSKKANAEASNGDKPPSGKNAAQAIPSPPNINDPDEVGRSPQCAVNRICV